MKSKVLFIVIAMVLVIFACGAIAKTAQQHNQKKAALSSEFVKAGKTPVIRSSGDAIMLNDGRIFEAGGFVPQKYQTAPEDSDFRKTYFYNPDTETYAKGPNLDSEITKVKLYILDDDNVLITGNDTIEVINIKTDKINKVLNKTDKTIDFSECQIVPIDKGKYFIVTYPLGAFADFKSYLDYYYIFDVTSNSLDLYAGNKEARIADAEVFPYKTNKIIAAYENKAGVIDITTGKLEYFSPTFHQYEMPAIIQLKDNRILYVQREELLKNIEIYNPDTNQFNVINVSNQKINTSTLFYLVLLENGNVYLQSDTPAVFDVVSEQLINLNMTIPYHFENKCIALKDNSVLCSGAYIIDKYYDMVYSKDIYKIKLDKIN